MDITINGILLAYIDLGNFVYTDWEMVAAVIILFSINLIIRSWRDE